MNVSIFDSTSHLSNSADNEPAVNVHDEAAAESGPCDHVAVEQTDSVNDRHQNSHIDNAPSHYNDCKLDSASEQTANTNHEPHVDDPIV